MSYKILLYRHYFEDEKPEIKIPRKLSENSTDSEEIKKNDTSNKINDNLINSINENQENLNIEENIKLHKKINIKKRRVSFDEKLVRIINVEKWKKYNEDVSLKNPLYIELLNKRKNSWDNCLIF